ncbi:MAG: pilus assembly protein [Candidatus Viridilinea halotolerans]|uniref:Pilus assembly protein n=1 Tax=Candidatus Viridilinea halotolerans TaxID=2491704 RepID=A0A426U0G5_9CHLR|nr:MAG: pilus assembly protein [Candidatus Viridilinea halotolerans]
METTPQQQRVAQRATGQSLVEFAMVIGILLMLIFALVNIGQLLLANYTVNQAARAAAHQAAISGAQQSAVDGAASLVMDAGVGTSFRQTQVEMVCGGACRRYDQVTIRVRFEEQFWAQLPLFDRFAVEAVATRALELDRQGTP